MDLMSLTARDLSNKCLEAFQTCLTFRSPDPDSSNQRASYDERFEYRLADFNLWIDGIGALAPSKASLDARLSERPIDLSLVKGNLVMLFQSLEDCLNLLNDNGSLEDPLLDVDSALESLVTLSLAIRRTGRRSRLHKADRLFKPEEHAELRKHLEAIIVLRPGSGPCFRDDEFRTKIESLTPLQNHLITANLKRRNRFIQAQLHSLGLKKRTVAFELPTLEAVEKGSNPTPISTSESEEIPVPVVSDTDAQPHKPLPAPMSVTSASVPESKLEYREPISKRTESTPMTVITQITASARYPRPRVYDNEQRVVQCPCCCQTLPLAEAKNNNRWRKHLAEDIRPYTCIFDSCPTPDVYYSSRSMLEQHFRQDHPPVWAHPDNGEDISSIISSAAQTRMGIKSCPLCEINGQPDSLELIDHVLEHVHDFSLRSLPWPRSSEVDMGGEVGYFNIERGEPAAIIEWLDAYEHEMEDIDPTLKLSTCDYGRLAIITEQMSSDGEDKLGLDIGFADEHDGESAEAETDISQLTQETLKSVKQARDVVFCHQCEARWYRDVDGMQCPKCQSEFVEIIDPESRPESSDLLGTVMKPGFATIDSRGGYGEDSGQSSDAKGSKSNTREPTSGFRRLTERLFSRKKADNIEPQKYTSEATNDFVRFLELKEKAGANKKAWNILISIYYSRLHSLMNAQTMFTILIRDVQKEDIPKNPQPVSDLRDFLEAMTKFYLNPLKHLPPKDLTKPISNYFINSSHRTLMHTLTDSRNAGDAITVALYLGYRSIDLDVWNGTTDTEQRDSQVEQPREPKPAQTIKTFNRLLGFNRESNAPKPVDLKTAVSQWGHMNSPAEPIVTDGYTLMTPCGFRKACQLIRDFAFVGTDLPLIVNLEVHADSRQQELMVKIMTEEWHDILLDRPLEACDPRFQLPTLEDLQGRILIRLGSFTSNFDRSNDKADDGLPGESDHKRARVAIIQPLAELEVYMRRERFENFDTPRTKSPTHLFSMQEGRVQDLISTSATELFRHNQRYFFRVYPSLARQGTSNLDPLRFWRYGIQMAGIVSHNVDEGMMLNEGMFADESGWVLKPDGYRSSKKDTSNDLEAGPRKSLDLSIFAFKDQEFMTSTGREIKNLASFMIVSLHIHDEEKPRIPRQELNTTEHESGALGYNLNFLVTRTEATIIPKLCILRLIFVEGLSKDHLFAWASLRLDRLNQGFRLVQLYDSKGLKLMQQRILLKFKIRWK
ncbi:hypothetical protein FVER53590_13780 [Fusarium verticillioides]|nr:hypothetical protein FVER53590_13780 [Fusarium verticillioides]